MKKLILVRHASTEALESRQVGVRLSDEPLSETGRSQARALAQRLSKIHIDAIYSSPQSRTVATACMVKPVVEAVDDLGDWRPAESHSDMYKRVTRFTDSLEEGTFVIVSHGTPIAMVLCHCVHASYMYQAGFGITPASISVIQDGVIVAINDTAHLNLWPEVADYDRLTWTYSEAEANAAGS